MGPEVIARARNSGLALVEVLVALAIVAIALPALLFSVDTVTEGTGHLRDKAIARWIASDRLTELRINRLNGQVPTGESSGEVEMARQRWRWQVQSFPTSLPGVRRLEVSVSRETGDPLVTLLSALEQ